MNGWVTSATGPEAAGSRNIAFYVHFPWCVRKCPYCDFNSHSLAGELPETEYVRALISDLEWMAPDIDDRIVTSVFLGGGTPSLFSPRAIEALVQAIDTRIGFAPDVEITLEANPGAIEHGSFSDYRAAGVNRVSLGAQTFSQPHLEKLGRIHSARDTMRAVAAVAAGGIGEMNLDLMYGLPGQTVEEACTDASLAIAAGATHISHYQLTIEPNTVFYARPPSLPDDDRCWEIMDQCAALFAEAGFRNYEVSAYARDGHACRHNLAYWRYLDYAGIGAGAHQKLTGPRGEIERIARVAHPKAYLDAAGSADVVARRWRVGPRDALFEFMLNALRLDESFSAVDFEQRTGVSQGALESALSTPVRQGLIQPDGEDRWRTTRLGRRFLNDLQAAFLPPEQPSRP